MTSPLTNETRTAPEELLKLATDLAVSAGTTVTEMRVEAVSSPTTKSSPTDPVTAADTRAEEIVTEGILAVRPHDSIVGEEGANHHGQSGVTWYIDPIDGTTNYLYGIPAYGVSIAAAVDGTMTAGVVFNPAADELFAATLGAGATLNGQTITATGQDSLASALVATGFSYLAERRRKQAAVIASLLPEVRDIRRIGSAALDLCAVACGRVDAYFEAGLNIWDFAAGWLIAAEAGAVCDDLHGGVPTEQFMFASGAGVHAPLAHLLQELNADHVLG